MSRHSLTTIRLVDELAANATAAATVQVLDGWLIRSNPYVPFRRCNSVLPYSIGEANVAERITLVESFYSERGTAARFQISPAAVPRELDEILEARGYVIETPTLVQFGDAKAVVEATDVAYFGPVVVGDGIDEYWVAEYARAHGEDEEGRERLRAYGRLMGQLGPAVGTAVLPVDGNPAAVGLGVVERGWVGVYAMGTKRELRRRGAGTAVLHALADWALERGARNLYLQVEVTNDGARQLYTRSGFQTAYRYHYRTLP